MQIDAFLTAALAEDIGWGDITTESCVAEDTQISGIFVAKEDTVVCGMDVVKRVFAILDPLVKVTEHLHDGDVAHVGVTIAEISGPARPILMGERVSLNLLQRLSGIASQTRKLVAQVESTNATIADTRKTTPGLRVLEKYAVRVGGGSNHRMGLSDGVLIKDNHIAAAGSITLAVERARKMAPHTLKIEVETATLTQVDEALEAGADIIMLDNMDLETMTQAVKKIGGKALSEASGNMGDKDLREVASTGVDIISVGAITHSVRSADISLRIHTR
jgi:nicotinate-nucleotide pyrophosphorylase (carboxylating)